jgi:NitT/TauT family transport system ATP-binding protein
MNNINENNDSINNKDSVLPPVVEFRDVSKVWNPGTPKAYTALEHLSFCIEDIPGKGEFITILGPSGCGKSTMLNLLAGFQEVFPPTTGEILVRGKRIERSGIDRGMVFQKYSSFPHLTVLRNVAFGMDINKKKLGLSDSEIYERSMDWINKVGLAGHENKYPHQLSGGQQQRVALARTLVLKPRIILMDEPFSALDEPTRLEMQRLVVELWDEVDATVLLVTHSIIEAVYLGDRVWLFSHAPGRIAAEFNDVPQPIPGEHPLIMQGEKKFLDAVEEVSEVFRKIEKEKLMKAVEKSENNGNSVKEKV